MWELQEHRKFIHFSLIVSSHVRNWTLALDNYKQTSGCSMLVVICDVSSDRFLVILSICFRRICSILLFIEIIWQPLVWSGSTRYLPQTNNAMRCFTYRRFHNWISYNYIISCLLSPASSSADAVWPDTYVILQCPSQVQARSCYRVVDISRHFRSHSQPSAPPEVASSPTIQSLLFAAVLCSEGGNYILYLSVQWELAHFLHPLHQYTKALSWEKSYNELLLWLQCQVLDGNDLQRLHPALAWAPLWRYPGWWELTRIKTGKILNWDGMELRGYWVINRSNS